MPAAFRGLSSPSLPPYLLLALLLHGLALYWLHPPGSRAPLSLPRLEMRLAPQPIAAPEPAADAPPAATASAAAPARPGIGDAHPPASEGRFRHDAAEQGAADLAAAARSFVQDESRRRSADPMYQAPRPRPSAPTVFERAAIRSVPGEKVLREGVVKITTPDGTSYCLQRPPAVANLDGPVAVVAIPVTCPIEF